MRCVVHLRREAACPPCTGCVVLGSSDEEAKRRSDWGEGRTKRGKERTHPISVLVGGDRPDVNREECGVSEWGGWESSGFIQDGGVLVGKWQGLYSEGIQCRVSLSTASIKQTCTCVYVTDD